MITSGSEKKRFAGGGDRRRYQSCLLGEREVHVDFGFYFHGTSVEEGGLVDPLLHCLNGGGHQQRMAADDGQVYYVAIFANDGIELHHTLNVGCLSQRRVRRGRFGSELGALDVAADAESWALWGGHSGQRGGRRRKGRDSSAGFCRLDVDRD